MARRGGADQRDGGYTFDREHFRNDTELSALLKGVVDNDMRSHMSATQRARAAWFTANGDVERKHTCGVYLDTAPTRKGRDPVLCVYVDSHARLADFNANKEIYLARLNGVGLKVSGLRFRLTDEKHLRKAREERQRREEAEQPRKTIDLPPLPEGERARIDRMCAGIPAELRPKVERAMELSIRREMLDNSQKQ